MEFLLEKSSPSEAYSTTYDFRIKEDFLISLVNIKLHGGNKLRKDRIISELKKQKMIDNT